MTDPLLANEQRIVAKAAIDPQAFLALYDHYFPLLYTYTRYRLGHDDAADDLSAHIFERALENIHTYEPESGSFRLWLFALAFDASEKYPNMLWRRLNLGKMPQSSTPIGEAGSVDRDQHDRLLSAIATLSDRERDLIFMKHTLELSQPEIAKITALPESDISAMLPDAISRLVAALGRHNLSADEAQIEALLKTIDQSHRSKSRQSLRQSLLNNRHRRASRLSRLLSPIPVWGAALALFALIAGIAVVAAALNPNREGQVAAVPDATNTDTPSSQPTVPNTALTAEQSSIAIPTATSTARPTEGIGTVLPTAHTGPLLYTVKQGDTLRTIMFRYNVPDGLQRLILDLNHLDSEADIVPGMTLVIPVPPLGYDKPHDTEPTEPCWEGIFRMEWPEGDPYALTESGEWIPCTDDIPSPTPVMIILSIEEVSAQTGFEVWEIGSVPNGYELESREALLEGDYRIAVTKYVNQASRPDKHINIVQVSPIRPLEALVEAIFLSDSFLEPEEITVNGEPALYVEKSRSRTFSFLIWNQEDFSFWIWSDDLTQEVLVDLAESLQ